LGAQYKNRRNKSANMAERQEYPVNSASHDQAKLPFGG